MERRRLLELVGLGCGLGLAGCASLLQSGSTQTPGQSQGQREGQSGGARSANADASTVQGAETPTPTATFSGEPYATAFLGNSYTARNDLAGVYRAVLRQSRTYETRPLRTRAVTAGGRRLHEHASQLSGGDVAPVLGGSGPSWNAVVLQEQSQVPGFRPANAERERSFDAAIRLARAADAHGAQTVLFMTWGRRTGDSQNPELYPDYETMQRRLAAGYRALADSIERAGYPVTVAPVGLAFRAVHDSVAAAGTDPATEGTAFWALYDSDGSHPSLQGTYLAALVLAGTAAGITPTDTTYVPDDIGRARAALLRRAAATVVSG